MTCDEHRCACCGHVAPWSDYHDHRRWDLGDVTLELAECPEPGCTGTAARSHEAFPCAALDGDGSRPGRGTEASNGLA